MDTENLLGIPKQPSKNGERSARIDKETTHRAKHPLKYDSNTPNIKYITQVRVDRSQGFLALSETDKVVVYPWSRRRVGGS